MAEDQGEKTLDPTPHRRQQARERGDVARSHDLSSAGILLGGLLVLVLTGGALFDFLTGLFASYLSGEAWMRTLASSSAGPDELVMREWTPLVAGLTKVLLPLLALVTLVAVGLNVLQTGVQFLPHKLLPDLSRISPLAGFGRLFSTGSVVRLAFGVFKIGVIGAVAFYDLYQRREALTSVTLLDLPQIATFAWDVCLWTCVKIGLALAALAVVDYGMQWWKHQRSLMMTPQELREEMRALQGDPQIAALRRQAQRAGKSR